MIVMVAFSLPVLCCLIGVGTFVLATTSVPDSDTTGAPNTAGDPNQPPTPPASAEELQAQLARLDKDIAALRSQLGQEDERQSLALKIRELIEKLASDTTGTAEALSHLATEIAAADTVLQKVNSSQNHGPDGVPPAPDSERDGVLTPSMIRSPTPTSPARNRV
jgi:hypothetical protein